MKSNPDMSWNEPTQSRSRAKVERILDAALELAAQNQSLEFKMTDVAKTARVAVGTLYQFFPHRSALIARLFAREMAPVDVSISELFSGDPTLDQLAERVHVLMRQHLNWIKTRPGLSTIWTAPQVHPDIERADLANTQANAALLATHLAKTLPKTVPQTQIDATALLICHLWSGVIRLCVLIDASQSETLLQQYGAMIMAHGSSLGQP